MQFDDDGLPPETPDPEAEARSAALNLDPERQSHAAIEFDALARQVAGKGIAFGQTERAFVASMQQYYRLVRKAFDETLAAQKQFNAAKEKAAAAGAAPPDEPPAPPDDPEG